MNFCEQHHFLIKIIKCLVFIYQVCLLTVHIINSTFIRGLDYEVVHFWITFG